MYTLGLILRGAIIAVFYNIMKSMSKFGHLDLHLFNLYLRFQLILHTVYNIAVAQNYCFKG